MSENNERKPEAGQGGDFGFFNEDEIPMKTATKRAKVLVDQVIPEYDTPTPNSPTVIEPREAEQPTTQADEQGHAEGQVEQVTGQSTEQKVETKKRGITSAHIKVLLSVALLVIGAVALWPAPPVPTTVAPVATPAPAPAGPTAAGQPGAPVTPTGEADAPALEIATTSADEESIDRLEQDVAAALEKLAPAEQVCSNIKALTSFDRHQCNEYGAEKFFKCTEQTGRFWNADVPGCEL